MTTLQPRKPYSNEELHLLYPQHLHLQQVQVFLRHGERTPVTPRFENAGLAPRKKFQPRDRERGGKRLTKVDWSYCSVAQRMVSPVLTTEGWDVLRWRRHIETFGPNDKPVAAVDTKGEREDVCLPGQLTDTGRRTTLALGQRLRNLYVSQLNFLPANLTDESTVRLRASPMPRARESVEQTFSGLYPAQYRANRETVPPIVARTVAEETLYPNDWNCKRFSQLFQAFGKRAADRWNDSPELDSVNKAISKWMPAKSPRVAVDSHPRLSGILDTVNSTLAHGPDTRLPREFYQPKNHEIIDRITTEEWFAGFLDSHEYRTLAMGPLVGDIVNRMIDKATDSQRLQQHYGSETQEQPRQPKITLSGCHDTTLGGILGTLGAFSGERWPPYSSSIALELFRTASGEASPSSSPKTKSSSLMGFFRGSSSESSADATSKNPGPNTRRPLHEYTEEERNSLAGYYVRVRYNDRVMQIPGCKLPGKHLDGDTTFCTLEAFKGIVDRVTPPDWKHACLQNLDKPEIPQRTEPAGYEE